MGERKWTTWWMRWDRMGRRARTSEDENNQIQRVLKDTNLLVRGRKAWD
jgi:hypothetical protein